MKGIVMNSKSFRATIVPYLALASITLSAQNQTAKITLVTKEISIEKMDAARLYNLMKSRKLSPNHRRLAYITSHNGKSAVVVDGVTGKEYDAVVNNTLKFSPDSKRVAYVAVRDGKQFYVIDDIEGKECYKYHAETLKFSPDSKSVAYVSIQEKQQFAVVDGIDGKKYSRVNGYSLQFSPDSKRVAYEAWQDKGCLLVIDGVEQKVDGFIDTLTFSPDSNRFAYVRRKGLNENRVACVVLDGVAQKDYASISFFQFSPDSKRIAYIAKRGERELVVIDNVEGKECESVYSRPIFSPDSKRVAYMAQEGNKDFVVLDGVQLKEYDSVGEFKFSPDSKRFVYLGASGGKWFLVLDGVEGKQFDRVITGDSSGIMPGSFVLSNQRQDYSAILRFSLHFSPDSRRVGYVSLTFSTISTSIDNITWFAVIDGVEGKGYEYVDIDSPTFAPDSKRFAYGAKRNGRQLIVVDGIEGKEYDAFFWHGGNLVFDGQNRLHGLALRNGEILRFDVEIVESR